MTWVIAVSTQFGHSVVFSDVRITEPSTGRSWDKLHKTRKMGQIVAGFAGRVDIGLDLLDSLEAFVKAHNYSDPCQIACEWQGQAKAIGIPGEDSRNQLLLVGNALNESRVLDRCVCIMDSIDGFTPQQRIGPKKITAIGELQRETLYPVFEQVLERPDFVARQMKAPNAMISFLTLFVTKTLFDQPSPGISTYMDKFVVDSTGPRELGPDNSDNRVGFFLHDRPSQIVTPLDNLISSRSEFNHFCKSLGESKTATAILA